MRKTVRRINLSTGRYQEYKIDTRPMLERIVSWFQNLEEKTANLPSKLDKAMDPIHSSLKEEKRLRFNAAVEEAMK